MNLQWYLRKVMNIRTVHAVESSLCRPWEICRGRATACICCSDHVQDGYMSYSHMQSTKFVKYCNRYGNIAQNLRVAVLFSLLTYSAQFGLPARSSFRRISILHDATAGPSHYGERQVSLYYRGLSKSTPWSGRIHDPVLAFHLDLSTWDITIVSPETPRSMCFKSGSTTLRR